ncbi:LysM peptidoglycan-binding domain-containing protein [Pseudomonas syringae pv. syringae]|uniref:FimV/HubP family polar landmark protein n=1 Tax=Pseudomonas TaxID=286 RepID=UPI0006B9A1C1|nr:FimV/HubP family polar landmark protein [Pseudomonas syringae]AVB27070.1 LysM peptidoglycan-binding domain-containing protein [Pseudomonas syringae pv. syringae]KPB19800.1 Peptidoglycan-binding LysM [Pseudomonas syringae pv. syringae]KWS07711.1 peptigoglycan-binding protein LysM [Pseudomonas syringae pv. syringae]MCF5182218.1 LysM peptidoglycan-binding domain-containing protein [Pseudomonas syringae]MCF5314688.1 LysM peptidoglycan-binding domain-containing protein [Pseudomonas syringae]
MLKSSLAAVEGAGRKAREAFGKGVLAVSLLTCSTLASALGLGEITLHSALNQPLDAEIQLLETGGLSNEDVVARLASPEAFAKAGMERVFFLNDLRFTPVLRGDRGVIRVVSSKPVTEPYLSFLVQLARPNGDLLHEYTLLLDPATSAQGLAATRSRNQQRSASSATESRMPVAPPAAVQGKHYTVASGDTLNGIASRLQGNKVSASQLADGIRSLNPQVFAAGAGSALKVGQDLLLPDAAVLPTAAAPAASAAAPSPKPAELQRTAEQLSAAAIENQQLTQSLEALKAQTQELQEQMSGKDKQIIALRSDLATAQSAATPVAPATVTPAPVTPAAAPAQLVAASGSDSFLSLPILLAAVLIVLLLVAFAYSKRRQQRMESGASAISPDDPLIKPAQAAMLPVFEVPAVAPQPVAQSPSTPPPAKPSPAQRSAGSAPDALDGVSIYIAYGRFTEAMGILRSALETQPERDDIRIRLLELLAEQGDGSGFVREEQAALEHGVDPQTIQDIRDRFPQLKAAEVAPLAAIVPAAAVAASTLSFEKSEPEPSRYLQPEPEPEPAAQLDESAAAALNPQPADEFQLNLDDLSMDADWDLVDPFDSPPPRAKPTAAPAPVEVDPGFSSDLTQLPEVFELSDEQFLSDFSEPEVVEPVEVIVPSAADGLSDDFLDSFMNDDADFDLLDLEEPPLSQINQAQVLIEDGDLESAREILQQIIDESDEEHQRMARQLLASIS